MAKDDEKDKAQAGGEVQEAPAKKTATIVLGIKVQKVAGKDMRIPQTVTVAKKSDMKKEHIHAVLRHGSILTIDGQKLKFDKDGNLV